MMGFNNAQEDMQQEMVKGHFQELPLNMEIKENHVDANAVQLQIENSDLHASFKRLLTGKEIDSQTGQETIILDEPPVNKIGANNLMFFVYSGTHKNTLLGKNNDEMISRRAKAIGGMILHEIGCRHKDYEVNLSKIRGITLGLTFAVYDSMTRSLDGLQVGLINESTKVMQTYNNTAKPGFLGSLKM